MDRPADLDLGDGHLLWWTVWKPYRSCNPQYVDLPDVDPFGAIISHSTPAGVECWSGVHFKSEAQARVFGGHPSWDLVSKDPLTLTPSLLCRLCGDHGFITAGKWVRA